MKEIKCPKCGQPIFENAYVCIHCETKINTCMSCYKKTTEGTACPKCKMAYPPAMLAEPTEADIADERKKTESWKNLSVENGEKEINVYERWKNKTGFNKFLGFYSRALRFWMRFFGLITIMIGQRLITEALSEDTFRFLLGLVFICVGSITFSASGIKRAFAYIWNSFGIVKMAREENLNFTPSVTKYYPVPSKVEYAYQAPLDCTVYAGLMATDKKNKAFMIVSVIIMTMVDLSIVLGSFILALAIAGEVIGVLVYLGIGCILFSVVWFIISGIFGSIYRKKLGKWHRRYFPESYLSGCARYSTVYEK